MKLINIFFKLQITIFKNIIKPIPPIRPVINRNVLLLSLRPKNCVKPSMETGIRRSIAMMNRVKEYSISEKKLYNRKTTKPV